MILDDSSILTNNVSIILPCYNKYNELKKSIEQNKIQLTQTHVKEVIIICDQVIDTNNFLYLSEYNINFVLYANTINHNAHITNISQVINFGISEATGKYCIIMYPETILSPNAIDKLITNTNDYSVAFGYSQKLIEESNIYSSRVPNGIFCCLKYNLEKIDNSTISLNYLNYFDIIKEKFKELDLLINQLEDVNVIQIKTTSEYYQQLLNESWDHNDPTEFKNNFVRIDNVNLEPLENQIKNITEIIEYKIKTNIKSYYPVILLAQSYNEEKNVKDFINNVSKFVDGIIILDDYSLDNTWNLLDINDDPTNKILLKIKKNRTTFNDLENRNLLLKTFENIFIRNNITVNWFLWLDFDERIENSPSILNYLKEKLLSTKMTSNILNILFVHMWNEEEYNTEYPCSDNGVQLHTRLIRNDVNRLPYIISSDKNLHFRLNPYKDKACGFPLVIKHLGRQSIEIRELKYVLYTEDYDKKLISQSSYKHFLKNDVKLCNFEDSKDLIFCKFIYVLQPVILYWDQETYETGCFISNILLGTKLIKLEPNINTIPDWINKKEHIIINLLPENLNIVTDIENKKIKHFNSNVSTINLCKNQNNRNILDSNQTDKINGKKLSVGVLDNYVFGIVETTYFTEITEIIEIIEISNIPTNIRDIILDTAKDIYNVCNCNSFVVIDFILDLNNKLHFSKINTNPSLAPSSILSKSVSYAGVNYKTFIKYIYKKYNSRSY